MTVYIHTDTRIAEGETLGGSDLSRDEQLDTAALLAYEDDTDGSAVLANAGTLSALNAVELDLTGLIVSRYSATGTGSFHNEATGILRVESTTAVDSDFGWGFFARGIYAPQQGVDVLNEGRIEVSSAYTSAVGIEIWGIFANTVDNRGEVYVSAGADATGMRLENTDILLNSGLIEVHAGEIAVGVRFGHYGGEGLDNSGTIIARAAPDSPWASVGVAFFSGNDDDATPNVLRNSGTIDAEIAILANDGNGLASTLPSREVLLNSGTLRGDVRLAYGNDSVSNTGRIEGIVELGQGADYFDGRRGWQMLVDGGSGDDVLVGGAGMDLLLGGDGADQIDAGGGDDVVLGGRGGDGLDGGAGFDQLNYADASHALVADLVAGTVLAAERDLVRGFEQLIGSRFADRIGGGAEAEFFVGAAGADTLAGGAGADTLHGGTGPDRLQGGAGADRFLYGAGDGVDTVVDFNPGIDVLRIHGHASATLEQVGEDTHLVLGGADRIVLKGVDASTLEGARIVFLPDATLPPPPVLADATQVVNEDLVVRSGEVLRLEDPLPVLLSDQWFDGTGIVLEAFGPMPDLYCAGRIEVLVHGDSAPAWGVVGSLADGPTTTGESEVVIDAGGTLAVRAAGLADAGGLRGVYSVWIAGALDVSSDAGGAIGLLGSGSGATLVNTGTITVSAAALATGADLTGSAWNEGTVAVHGGADATGIRLYAVHAGTVLVNSGEVRVTDTSAARDGAALRVGNAAWDYAGNQGYASLPVWNSGTLAGDWSIRAFSPLSPEQPAGFSIYNSGVLDGAVELRTGNDVLLNTGSVLGEVRLGGGDDRYDGRGGSLQGRVLAGDGADLLIAGNGGEALSGGRGADTLAGGVGADTLSGGEGNDLFHFAAGGGHDTLAGFTAGGVLDRIRVSGYSDWTALEQVGDDTRVWFSASDSLLLRDVNAADLQAQDFRFDAAALAPAPLAPLPPAPPLAPPTPAADEVAVLARFGSGQGDTLDGSGDPDLLYGLDGDDTLRGADGTDTLQGGGGSDRLRGDAGDDILTGGGGRDVLAGGEGADRFVFDDGDLRGTTAAAPESILDFDGAAGDRIDVSGIDASPRLFGDDAFVLIGGAAFSGTQGELRWEALAGSVLLTGDLDGDGAADFCIRLAGVSALSAADLML